MNAYPVREQNKIMLVLDGSEIRVFPVPLKIVTINGHVLLSYEEAVTLLGELQWAIEACSPEPLGKEATATLMAELREKLPEHEIYIHTADQAITFYDYYAVTYRHTNAEDAVVDQYLTEIVSRKVGAAVTLTKQRSAGNGHEWRGFTRVTSS